MRPAAAQISEIPPQVVEAKRVIEDLVRDKSYQAFPMGQEAAAYLRAKRKRLTPSSYRDYESCLDKLARHFCHLHLEDFEPPIGTQRLEEFLDRQWGDCEPRTYNKNLSIVGDFFNFQVRLSRLHGDPTTAIERAKARGVYRTIFSADQRRAILASQDELRDRVGLRLLLDYGLRKGSLQAARFKHFDHVRKRLTIFAKGGKVRNVPIPDPAFWHDLERLILDTEAEADHFLMQRTKGNKAVIRRIPDQPMGAHGMHSWWYRCLARAGVVPTGTEHGENIHKARHSAGQRLLDHTGNLKAVQQLLGHESIMTTGDIYVGWDEEQLATSLESVLRQEKEDEQ
jgi:site-specific recombinase XerD